MSLDIFSGTGLSPSSTATMGRCPSDEGASAIAGEFDLEADNVPQKLVVCDMDTVRLKAAAK
jgi:hypothetical protein